MSQILTDILRKLPASGEDGFEGLIAKLLTHISGQQFHLAKAGSQQGRDISSRPHNYGNIIAVECKRYQKNTKLDQRELLGEITEVILDMPDLDLWVLVTSRDVPSQLREILRRATHKHGIELLIISDEDATPSSLAILCAQAPDLVLSSINSLPTNNTSDVHQLLKDIAALPEFEARSLELKEALTSSLLGFNNWKIKHNQRLSGAFQTEGASRTYFGQLLNISQEGVTLITREEVHQRLDNWFNQLENNPKQFVLLGEEGDGKTWSIASWVERKITDSNSPAIIFESSAKLTTNNPFEILSETFQKIGMITKEQANKRIHTWLQKPIDSSPLFVLVLDGINQHHDINWWRNLLEGLNNEPYLGRIAVIITCRSAYWKSNFASFTSSKVITYELQPYNDHELQEALNKYGLRQTDIHKELFSFARKPRYLDLIVKYQERLINSGDITVARLIYEDWRDRLERKHGELTDENFQEILQELANQYYNGTVCLNKRELANMIPGADKLTLEELCTSGIFSQHTGQLRVKPPHLILGLALLLVREVNKASQNNKNLVETIAEWLEPQAAIDMKAQICEAATLCALEDKELPTNVKVALLHAWINSQNISTTTESNLDAYFPVDPESYFSLAEAVWSDSFDNRWAQQVLMRTFLKWMRKQLAAEKHDIWQKQLTYWLGFTHRSYHPYLGEKTEENIQEYRLHINEKWGSELSLGPVEIGSYKLHIIEDDGLIRLARMALALISHFPREPYIHALVTGTLAGSLMERDDRDKVFSWIVASSQTPLWSLAKGEVEQLITIDKQFAQQAAHRFLSYIDTQEAIQLQQTLPNNLFPQSEIQKQHLQDPCRSHFSWSREDCEHCISREDVSIQRLADEIARYCIDPLLPVPTNLRQRLESLVGTIHSQEIQDLKDYSRADLLYDRYEPSLCAYTPQTAIKVIQNFVQNLEKREHYSLQKMALSLPKYSLILTNKENTIIHQAWQQLHEKKDLNNQEKLTEVFLFQEILRQNEGLEQLKLLLNRSDDLSNLNNYQLYFKPINNIEDIWTIFKSIISNKVLLRRFLWFINHIIELLSIDNILQYVIPIALDNDDSLIRSVALQIVYNSRFEQAANKVVPVWSWSQDFHDEENQWGSLLLADYGKQLTFSDIRNRIHPTYLGYTIQQRGNRLEEIEEYAQTLHNYWQALNEQFVEPPKDFPGFYFDNYLGMNNASSVNKMKLNQPSQDIQATAFVSSWGGDRSTDTSFFESMVEGKHEQWQKDAWARFTEISKQQWGIGNHWFARRFQSEVLADIIRNYPKRIEQWINVSKQEIDKSKLIAGSTFYETLCIELLRTKPEYGIVLYKQLQDTQLYTRTIDGRMQLCLFDIALFQLPRNAESEQIWEQKLDNAYDDQALLDIAILVHNTEAQAWLSEKIDQALDFTNPLQAMRAIRLLGFINDEACLTKLITLRDELSGTRSGRLAQLSIECQQDNDWAKYWFKRFLNHSDTGIAWAAFRLFLRCVDRRFWLWQHDIIEQLGSNIPLDRLNFLAFNEDDIKNNIKEKDKTLTKHFIGHTVLKGEVWPWMNNIQE